MATTTTESCNKNEAIKNQRGNYGSINLSSISLGQGRSLSFRRPVIIRYAPTYRLESKNPFNRDTCANILKRAMTDSLGSFQYTSKAAQSLSKSISEEIQYRIKACYFDRYKTICIVTIGEKFMQGFCTKASFLWDAEKDGFVNYVHDTPEFFAIATVYYLYYD